MTGLARHRHRLHRSRVFRVLFGVLVLAIAFAGMPRWEQHTHAISDAQHIHEHEPALHTFDAPKKVDDATELAFHVHEIATLTAALPSLMVAPSPTSIPERWERGASLAPAVRNAWPPPYRPPIA